MRIHYPALFSLGRLGQNIVSLDKQEHEKIHSIAHKEGKDNSGNQNVHHRTSQFGHIGHSPVT